MSNSAGQVVNVVVGRSVTLALAGGFVLGFAVLKLISGEVYTAVVTGVIGYWFAARQADTDHQLSHICAAVKDDRLQVMFSCPAGLGDSGSMDRCAVTTCAVALATL